MLNYAFGLYEVNNTSAVSFVRENPRPAPPAPISGALRVAGFNVLNYFTTLDTGSAICGPSGGLDCQGANSAAEFNRQRTKILAALVSINADVFGLIELENNASTAIADPRTVSTRFLGRARIPTSIPAPSAPTPSKVGLVYKPARVTLVGTHKLLTQAVDPNFIDTLNRPVLAQTFRHIATGEVVTVAVNHLKSKGSACDRVLADAAAGG